MNGVNVLVINGSPKLEKSNTYRLTTAFLEGMIQHSPKEVVVLHTKRLQIKPCLGCFTCWSKTPGKCCLQDDMTDVIVKILWADVIIWSFPLYYFGVPGPLKNLMDRQLPMTLPFMRAEAESGGHPSRYDMSGKRHVIISTCGFYTARGNYDGVNAMFDHLCGKGNYTAIYCGQGELFRVPELRERTDAYLAIVRRAGLEFCGDGIKNRTRNELEQLLFPREVFEAMADASWGVEKDGEKSDETLTFTRQMAALYNKTSFDGRERVLEMDYTDCGRRYQIVLGKEGSTVLTENFRTATTVIETTYSLWKAIASGEISGQEALMQQQYRVKGDFNLMIFWDKYFGVGRTEPSPEKPQKTTNMMLLLAPWIVFWAATSSLDHMTAALVSILLTVLAPLILHKNRMLFFDHISAAAVAALSALLVIGLPVGVVLPLSYLGFGLLWTINGLRKIPLTAHYSLNDYGGENMLANPLFLKTNRILTLCWGVLYLSMTLWSFILLAMDIACVAIINSILPAVMGIFTVWFQKWYPAKVARGQ